MALNCSRRPVFSACLSEDNIVSPMRIGNGYIVEGLTEKSEDCFGYGRDRNGSQESVHKDILDLLPSDPFGMDISTTFTAINGWLADLKVDYPVYGSTQAPLRDGNCQLFAGFNFVWNNAMGFPAFPGNVGFDANANVASGFDYWCFTEKEAGQSSSLDDIDLACNTDAILPLEDEIMKDECFNVVDETSGEFQVGSGVGIDGEGEAAIDGEGGAPHAAFTFALSYLGVRDLLAVEAVCKYLRSTVRNDPLLWRSIHIDQPLNEKITDSVLMQLTDRAQGKLQCLRLVECPRITDDALKHVLGNNLRLSKLSVPGCTRLSIDGIVASLKAFKTMGAQGVKCLRIGGLYGVTLDHFEELNILLGADGNLPRNDRAPHFYQRGNFYLSCEDDCAIDIELCPRCQNLRMVYDCPMDGCQGKTHPTQICRACTLCIARCFQCGRCINDVEYEETFCLQLRCADCWKQLPQSQEQEGNNGLPEDSSFDEASRSHHLCG